MIEGGTEPSPIPEEGYVIRSSPKHWGRMAGYRPDLAKPLELDRKPNRAERRKAKSNARRTKERFRVKRGWRE